MTDHIVVEVPPGETWCQARKAVWKAVKDDATTSGQAVKDKYILKQPPRVIVDGYVFLDGAHARRRRRADCSGPVVPAYARRLATLVACRVSQQKTSLAGSGCPPGDVSGRFSPKESVADITARD